MSFILDALRKSDQDRQRAAVPGVQTMHAPAAAAAKRPFWPYALLIAAIIAGIAIMQWPKPQTASVTMTQRPMHQPEKIAEQKPQQGELPVNAPAPSPSSATSDQLQAEESTAAGASQPTNAAPVPEVAATGEAGQADAEEPVEWIEITPQVPTDTSQDISEAEDEPIIPNVHALPPSMQRQLPAIAIAAQIYDSDPASRMAIINGSSVREGGVIAPGLILETIGENGIVLNFQGQRFQMDVFQNWSGN